MATGTAAAQLVTMAVSPVITRLYGPEAFGVLGVFTSAAGVLVPIAALAYPIAIVLPRLDSDARQLVRLSTYLAVAISSVFAVIILLAGHGIAEALQIPEISSFLLLLPVFMLFSALQQVAMQWQIRQKQFTRIARSNVIQALVVGGFQIVVGLVQPVAASLVYLQSFGKLIHACLLARPKIGDPTTNFPDPQPAGSDNSAGIRKIAHRYRDFPFLRAPQLLTNSVSQGLPVLMLATFFGPAIAGFYTLCRMVLSAPSQLIGASVGDVFYPRIAEAARSGAKLTNLITKATLGLAAAGMFPYLVVIIFGPFLFGLVFGEEWLVAGQYARWIALWQFFMLINRPSVQAIPILNAQGLHLALSPLFVLLRLGALALGYYAFDSALVSVALFGITGMMVNIILILVILRLSRRHDSGERPGRAD